MMYALIASPWYFLDLRCSLRADRKRVVDLLAAILCRRARGSYNINFACMRDGGCESGLAFHAHSTHAVRAVCQ